MLTVEFCLLRLAPGCALQRLLTLSLRFIIALCTKPPIPFVGELGRSAALARRACDDEIERFRLKSPCCSVPVEEAWSDIGEACRCASSSARSDLRSALLSVAFEGVAETRLLAMPLSRAEVVVDALSDPKLSAGVGPAGLDGSDAVSRARPGSTLLLEATLCPAEASSLLFRYAADPVPLSAVCRNHAGSLDPREAAILSLLGSGWSRDAFLACPLSSLPTHDVGLLARDAFLACPLSSPPTTEAGLLAPLDCGRRCCQDNVPDLARLLALGEGREEAGSVVCAEADAVEGVFEVLPELKPLNSGMSLVGDGGPAPLTSMAGSRGAMEGLNGCGCGGVWIRLSLRADVGECIS